MNFGMTNNITTEEFKYTEAEGMTRQIDDEVEGVKHICKTCMRRPTEQIVWELKTDANREFNTNCEGCGEYCGNYLDAFVGHNRNSKIYCKDCRQHTRQENTPPIKGRCNLCNDAIRPCECNYEDCVNCADCENNIEEITICKGCEEVEYNKYACCKCGDTEDSNMSFRRRFLCAFDNNNTRETIPSNMNSFEPNFRDLPYTIKCKYLELQEQPNKHEFWEMFMKVRCNECFRDDLANEYDIYPCEECDAWIDEDDMTNRENRDHTLCEDCFDCLYTCSNCDENLNGDYDFEDPNCEECNDCYNDSDNDSDGEDHSINYGVAVPFSEDKIKKVRATNLLMTCCLLCNHIKEYSDLCFCIDCSSNTIEEYYFRYCRNQIKGIIKTTDPLTFDECKISRQIEIRIAYFDKKKELIQKLLHIHIDSKKVVKGCIDEDNDNCPICLGEEESIMVERLCGHKLNYTCNSKWNKQSLINEGYKNDHIQPLELGKCPCCRQSGFKL